MGTQKQLQSEWVVLPHDRPVALAENLWRVEGDLPGMPLRRCMVVARLSDGRLVSHNPMALDEEGMAWLGSLGTPAVMVVPNGWHRIDAGRFKGRFPEIAVVCPRGARRKVEQRVPVDATFDTPPALDASVSLTHLDGMREAEGVLSVRSADGVTLVFNDVLFNLAHGRGFFWWFYGRVLGNTGGLKTTSLMRWFVVKDLKALRAHLARLAETPDLRRVVVAHGEVIDASAADRLLAAAARRSDQRTG